MEKEKRPWYPGWPELRRRWLKDATVSQFVSSTTGPSGQLNNYRSDRGDNNVI